MSPGLLIEFLWLFKGCVFCLDCHRTEMDGPNTIPEQKWDLHRQKGEMGSEEGTEVEKLLGEINMFCSHL